MNWSTYSFIVGLVCGGVFGLILAGLLGMAHQGDYLAELADAYNDGVRVGKANPGARLRANVSKLDRGIED